MKKFSSRKKPDKVRFLADECVGLPSLKLLEDSGFSVVTVKESGLAGKSDFEILKWAIKAGKVLLTEDIDFGNIVLYPPKLHHGIVLLRFRHKLEEEIHVTLLKLLNELKSKDFKKTLIIVDADKYRLRKE